MITQMSCRGMTALCQQKERSEKKGAYEETHWVFAHKALTCPLKYLKTVYHVVERFTQLRL